TSPFRGVLSISHTSLCQSSPPRFDGLEKSRPRQRGSDRQAVVLLVFRCSSSSTHTRGFGCLCASARIRKRRYFPSRFGQRVFISSIFRKRNYRFGSSEI